ncbi:hypothetical protein K040078D81_44070 [Blautia hominis]|uniref:Radical SAM core domain-containing protein n=1 Tax=Blautia hominis TaxID=2025493 RepID=A0ABQ0BFP6_9FIRM
MEFNALKFKTDNGNDYIYDNEMGMILPCPDYEYYIIENYYKLDKSEIINNLIAKFNKSEEDAEAAFRYIAIQVSKGCFYKKEEIDKIERITLEDIEMTDMSQLILITTEDCNIRCKYCIYSDNYPDVKSYSKKSMDIKTAKKAVDYYRDLHAKRVKRGFRRKPIITFYGGEPFLAFKLIKEVVKYCKETQFDTLFFVTTNATIFTDEMINFIIENNLIVTFSLDGNESNHNRNRVFSNGKGTFDLVIKNINKLQEAKKKRNISEAISFSCCYDNYTDMVEVIKFFEENHDLFYPYTVFYSQISKLDTNYYDYCKSAHEAGVIETDEYTFGKSVNVLLKEFLEKIMKEETPPISLTALFMAIKYIIWRSRGEMDIMEPSCTPGSKIAVAPDGNFYVCERVSQANSSCIGDVEHGLMIEKINIMIDEYKKIRQENCKRCPVSRLCAMCFMHLSKGNTMEFNYELCSENRRDIPRSLSRAFSILEIMPNAFDVFDSKDANKDLYEIR